MVNKVQVFFDAARARAQQDREAAQARDLAEQTRKATQASNMAILKEQVQEEFGSLLDVLAKLPENDGKVFIVTMKDSLERSTTDAGQHIGVMYQRKRSPRDEGEELRRSFAERGDYVPAQPGFGLDVTRNAEGGLKISVTQYSETKINRDHSGNHHNVVETPDFAAARKEMGRGIGLIAPGRLDDIGAALGLSAAAAKPAAPKGVTL